MFQKEVLPKKDFLQFLETIRINRKIEGKQQSTIGILVTPWLCTPVPWYSIIIGAMIRYRGYKVTLIVNDMWSSCKCVVPYYKYKEQCREIVKVVSQNKIIRKYFEVIFLSKVDKASLTGEDGEKLQELAQIAAIRQFESSGKADTEEYRQAVQNWENIFHEFYPYILSVMKKECWQKIIIPGGLFLDSGLFFEAAQKQNIAVITYDSSISSAYVGINTKAGRNGNVQEAVDVLIEQGKGTVIYEEALSILEKRKKGEKDSSPHMNFEVIQNSRYGTLRMEDGYDVVIFMNVEADTAAMGTHIVFRNDLEWITETVKYIIEKTDLRVAVREHPLQRLFGRTDLSTRVKELEVENRMRFFQYDDSINSYDLIESAKVIVVCTSTVGLEAAMYGKTVVLESDCYYSDISCVKQANTKEQYFQYIVDAVMQPMHMNQADKERIAAFYYLTQRYGSRRDGFTAQPDVFAANIQKSFDEIQTREDVRILIDCMLEEKPLCLALYEWEHNLG